MIKGLITDYLAARTLANAAKSLRATVTYAAERAFDGATASQGIDSAPPPNVYRNQVIFKGSLPSLNSLFDYFAYKKLSRWRLDNSRATPSSAGGRLLLQYSANRNFRVRLAPLTFWSSGRENLEQGAGRNYDRCIERISYEYICEFDFESQGNQVAVSYTTTETINGDGGARRDLVKHYRAPPLPQGFGNIGELFIAGLVARGLV